MPRPGGITTGCVWTGGRFKKVPNHAALPGDAAVLRSAQVDPAKPAALGVVFHSLSVSRMVLTPGHWRRGRA